MKKYSSAARLKYGSVELLRKQSIFSSIFSIKTMRKTIKE
jgi:hypothetical protein